MNEIDRILNSDQYNEISVQNPMPNEGIARNDDQLVHDPQNTSQEMTLDDEQEVLRGESDPLLEAAENAAGTKR